MNRRCFLRDGVCTLLCVSNVAQVLWAEDSKSEVREVDLRNRSEPENFAIVFCARGPSLKDKSVFGHAFVVWGKDDDKKQVCTAAAFGFFPETQGDEIKSVVREVPGAVSDAVIRNKPASGDCRVIINVNRDQWEAAERIRTDWAKKAYMLRKKDCVSFAADVAASLKLKAPERGSFELPEDYIRKLADMNK